MIKKYGVKIIVPRKAVVETERIRLARGKPCGNVFNKTSLSDGAVENAVTRRKNARAGIPPVEPDYTVRDAEEAIRLFEGVDYNKRVEIAPGVEVRFTDVGHLLGSASIEIWVYGNRNHPPRPDYIGQLAAILQRTFDRGGNVVIPSFAVGRTQELLYFLREIKEKKLVTGHGNFPVYVDSPLAIEATRIFRDTDASCFDDETRALLASGIDPITFAGLRVSVTSDESREINADLTPKVILSASGMCDAGRIRHHLKHNLWRKECTILFVGYQAVGTLGRALLEGIEGVKLFGEEIEVRAEIAQIGGMSGHADREGLLKWVNSFEPKPRRVFVNHGDDAVEDEFVNTLQSLGYTACAPYNGAQWALGADGAVCLSEGSRERTVARASTPTLSRAAAVYQRLVSAGRRLMRVIEHNEGGANKDLAKFADQINALCDKWDR